MKTIALILMLAFGAGTAAAADPGILRAWTEYTNVRNERDRGFQQRIDLCQDDKTLLRERSSIYSNAAVEAERKAKKTEIKMIIAEIGAGAMAILSIILVFK